MIGKAVTPAVIAERLDDRFAPPFSGRIHDEFEALAEPYHCDDVMHQDYLLTRARAA